MRRCTCIDDERTCEEHNINRTELERLRAEVRDLKARLRAARSVGEAMQERAPALLLKRITDLRRKNWRKP